MLVGIADETTPTTSNAFDRTFNGETDIGILILDANLTTLEYGSYIGGKGKDLFHDAYIDINDVLYIVGETNSADYPVLDGVLDTTYNGNKDVFISKSISYLVSSFR